MNHILGIPVSTIDKYGKAEHVDESKLDNIDKLALEAWRKTTYIIGWTCWKTAFRAGYNIKNKHHEDNNI